MLPTSYGFFCASCKLSEQETMLHDRLLPPMTGGLRHDEKTPSLGVQPPPQGEFKLEPVQPSDVVKVAEVNPFDATKLMHAVKTPPPASPPAGKELRPPERKDEKVPAGMEGLFLPRCKECSRPLELEEIANGICRHCAEKQTPKTEEEVETSLARGAAGLVVGEFAALTTLWAGAIALVRAVISNPDSWGLHDLCLHASRAALAIFAFVASICWCLGRPWATGTALAFGPAVIALAMSQLRSGSLVKDLAAASAWVLAALAGAIATAMAVSECISGKSNWGSGQTDTGRTHLARRVTGGMLALAMAGFAAWRAATAAATLSNYSPVRHGGEFWPLVQSTAGMSLSAIAGLALAVILFAAPPRGRTHITALAGALAAGLLPCWMGLGLAAAAGGTIDAKTLALAPAAGLGRVLGVSALADAWLAQTVPTVTWRWTLLGALLTLGGASAAGIWTLTAGQLERGKVLAGFTLSCVLAWGAGLASAALS